MKLYYTENNAYSSLIAIDDDRAECYMMDGSEDFPIINQSWIEAHPEYESFCGDLREGQSASYRPAIEKAAADYLARCAETISEWSGAETEIDRDDDESAEDFETRVLDGDDILAAFGIDANARRIWYAVERDEDDNDWGYGSEDRATAIRMAEELGDNSLIAVIDTTDDDPLCIAELRRDENGEWN